MQVVLLFASLLLTQATAFQSPLGARIQLGNSQRRCDGQHCDRVGRNTQTRLHRLTATTTPLETFFKNFSSFLPKQTADNRKINAAATTVEAFFNAWSERDATEALSMLDEDCVFDNVAFSKPWVGKEELERRLRLEFDATSTILVVDDIAVENAKVGVRFHAETIAGVPVDNSRGSAFFQLDNDTKETIERVFWVIESAQKSGEDGLRLLTGASKIIEAQNKNKKPSITTATDTSPRTGAAKSTSTLTGLTAPEQYFAAWSKRDMELAVSMFADTVTYDDTAFPEAFSGKENARKHLLKCADAFPAAFTFEVDDLINGGDRIAVLWHVNNGGEPLPFTRGCSFYELDSKGRIQDGIDFVEPAPVKLGGPALFVQSMKTKLAREPARWIPIVAWVAYIYIVFVSDGILPGANALQLEQRTWEEVRDLSLNFFLVSPLLGLPFSPVVHPMLEGVFNLLLSWAAMFAGFLSDDRRDKPNLLPTLPVVIGMQFLTSAFLLPYLATRTTEYSDNVTREDLSPIAQGSESPLLGVSMGLVGSGSIAWFFMGRSEFGGLNERWTSFIDLMSIDRVGTSFIVDLVIFGLFQAWLVDDDLKRRGVSNLQTPLAFIAKYVPFFGLAAYLSLRPSLPAKTD
jgi:ketosteroid isomerase-like protein